MSVNSTEAVVGADEIELPPHGDAAFASLMDALAPEPGAEAAAEAGAKVGAPAGTPAAPAPDADGAAAGTAGAPAAGAAAAGGTAAPGADGAAAGSAELPAAEAGAGDRPAAWTTSAADFIPKLGELSTQLEENTSKAYQSAALETVREDHANYFEALEKHPRLLVGTQVPAIGKEGMETLRDTNDAREWQDAVKSILVSEVRDRAGRQMEESADFLATIHSSIELFQNNVDLIPGTKDFDVELANRFATMATPYELRVEGKLQGYSIPVQPIIGQLRAQITAERAAKKTPEATPQVAGQPPVAAPTEQPQAGITSKSGNSSATEDFSTLFGTLGLPNLQI